MNTNQLIRALTLLLLSIYNSSLIGISYHLVIYLLSSSESFIVFSTSSLYVMLSITVGICLNLSLYYTYAPRRCLRNMTALKFVVLSIITGLSTTLFAVIATS